jgi:hypothetical protein
VKKIVDSVLEMFLDLAPVAHSTIRLILKNRFRIRYRKADLRFTPIATARYKEAKADTCKAILALRALGVPLVFID